MFEKFNLKNGTRVVFERINHIRSVCIGVWVGTGSVNEKPENNGISHYIEHMLFKGTEKRTAKEIAECIDNIGGQINAFTSKECTCYYTKTLDAHLEIAIDLLADMYFKSKFDKKDLDVERRVIVEEINMYEDSPEELVHDLLAEAVWGGSALGFPVLGTSESLKAIDKKVINQYMALQYVPENTVISVAGNVELDKLKILLEDKFNSQSMGIYNSGNRDEIAFVNRNLFKEKETEQVHLCLGFEGLPSGQEDLYTLMAVNNILGGGMSSRLFQKIREEQGLVYSIYSYPSTHRKTGLFTIYAGMNPEYAKKVKDLIYQELNLLLKNGISTDELNKSKEQLKGSYILGLESTSGRMNSIGKSELMLGRTYSPEEVLKKIENINMEKAEEIIKKVFKLDKIGMAAVGNLKDAHLED